MRGDPMSKKLLFSAFSLVVCIMFISPYSLTIATAKEISMPTPTGPYKVGAEWLYWVDESRDEIFDKAPHGKREMMIEILYPANPKADAKTASYMVNKKAVLPA